MFILDEIILIGKDHLQVIIQVSIYFSFELNMYPFLKWK